MKFVVTPVLDTRETALASPTTGEDKCVRVDPPHAVVMEAKYCCKELAASESIHVRNNAPYNSEDFSPIVFVGYRYEDKVFHANVCPYCGEKIELEVI